MAETETHGPGAPRTPASCRANAAPARRRGRLGAPASCCVNAALPDDRDGLERRSLTGTRPGGPQRRTGPRPDGAGRRRRAIRACSKSAFARRRRAVPVRDRRSKPVGHQVACDPPLSNIFVPDGVRRRTRAWRFLPVGASDRHRPPPVGEHVLAARRGGGKPPASSSGPGAVGRRGPPGRVPVRDRRSKPSPSLGGGRLFAATGRRSLGSWSSLRSGSPPFPQRR